MANLQEAKFFISSSGDESSLFLNQKKAWELEDPSKKKLFHKDHPLKESSSNMPDFLKRELLFILKEENSGKIKFHPNKYKQGSNYSLSLRRASSQIPALFISTSKSGIDYSFNFKVEPDNKKAVLVGESPGFIHVGKHHSSNILVNGKVIMGFHGASGTQDISEYLVNNRDATFSVKVTQKKGENIFIYIQTSTFSKRISQVSNTDDEQDFSIPIK